MKKAGILTFHSVLNYGSALQAVAMQNMLEECGLEVQIIDYRPTSDVSQVSFGTKLLKVIKPAVWKRRISYYWFAVTRKFYQGREKRQGLYEEFFTKNMKLSKRCHDKEELRETAKQYDYLVCGSDQIWNPNYLAGDFSYFLDFCHDKSRKIAYAPSIAVEKIEERWIGQFKAAVEGFDYLSVREESSVKMIRELTGKEAELVLDPTMMVNEEIWKHYYKPMEEKDPYILSYFLGDNVEYQETVLRLKKATGLKIKNIPHMYLWAAKEYYDFGDERIIEAGPAEFLSLVENAAYVCTDSFHGSVFSILFEKNFFVFRRYQDIKSNSENSRIYTLLKTLGLEDRLISIQDELFQCMESKIDYIRVKKIIAEKRERSKAFLVNALKGGAAE